MMAGGGELDDDFICPVCLELMQLPITLSCGHSGCKPCIAKWVAQRTSPHCPVCREPASRASVERLRVSIILQRVIAPMAERQRAADEERAAKQRQRDTEEAARRVLRKGAERRRRLEAEEAAR